MHFHKPNHCCSGKGSPKPTSEKVQLQTSGCREFSFSWGGMCDKGNAGFHEQKSILIGFCYINIVNIEYIIDQIYHIYIYIYHISYIIYHKDHVAYIHQPEL